MPDDVTMSDRELDARVAEAVFGWRWWRYTFGQGDADDYRNAVVRSIHPPGWPPQTDQWREWGDEAGLAPADGTEPIHCLYGMGDAMFVAELPGYSSDMTAAWLVVEELKRYGWRCYVRDCPGDPIISKGAACQMQKGDAAGPSTDHVAADTAPRAICLAALAALTKGHHAPR